jgi:hypothetical protein
VTPENAELLAEYAGHLEHSPLTGHSPRTYLGAVRAYLAWLEEAEVDGDPLNDATAKDWAVRDYRSYLVTVAKRATATVNKHLAALQDFYLWRGLGPPQGVRRHPGTRMTTDAIADVLAAITVGAGLEDHVTSHVLRHTFGTELTRRGVDLVTVAELMGHASLETTRLYTRPTAADMQQAVDLLTVDE